MIYNLNDNDLLLEVCRAIVESDQNDELLDEATDYVMGCLNEKYEIDADLLKECAEYILESKYHFKSDKEKKTYKSLRSKGVSDRVAKNAAIAHAGDEYSELPEILNKKNVDIQHGGKKFRSELRKYLKANNDEGYKDDIGQSKVWKRGDKSEEALMKIQDKLRKKHKMNDTYY